MADRLAAVGEELLEAQAVEEPLEGPTPTPSSKPRLRVRFPSLPGQAEVDVWRGEVRTAAIAAAGGHRRRRRDCRGRPRCRAGPRSFAQGHHPARQEGPQNVVASRSFLVDVHVLGR